MMIRHCFGGACAHSSRAPKTAGTLEVCEQLMYLQHTNQRFSEIMSSDPLASRIAGGDLELPWLILVCIRVGPSESIHENALKT